MQIEYHIKTNMQKYKQIEHKSNSFISTTQMAVVKIFDIQLRKFEITIPHSSTLGMCELPQTISKI